MIDNTFLHENHVRNQLNTRSQNIYTSFFFISCNHSCHGWLQVDVLFVYIKAILDIHVSASVVTIPTSFIPIHCFSQNLDRFCFPFGSVIPIQSLFVILSWDLFHCIFLNLLSLCFLFASITPIQSHVSCCPSLESFPLSFPRGCHLYTIACCHH